MKRDLLVLLLVAASLCACDSNTETPTPTPATTSPGAVENSAEVVVIPPEFQSEYAPLPTLGIELMRPEGFVEANGFFGFQQQATQSSVMVTKVPAPFSELLKEFTPDQMKARGMTFISKDMKIIDGKSGVLYNITQIVNGILVEKWLVAFGDNQETVMVSANFPQTKAAELSDPLKYSALSVRKYSSPLPAAETDFGFTITPSPMLKRVKGAQVIGKMSAFTKNGLMPVASPIDPLFIAGPSVTNMPLDMSREEFAVQRLHQTALTKVNAVSSIEPITIDGRQGFEILAKAEVTETGIPLAFYQVILFGESADDRTYFIIQGLVGETTSAQYLPVFKSMAQSLKIK